MDIILLCFYLFLFAAQLTVLVFAVRKPEKKLWPALFGLELLSGLSAVGLAFVFDALPGHGKAPGLTYFAEFFYSFFAAIGYVVMFFLSLLVWLIWTWRNDG